MLSVRFYHQLIACLIIGSFLSALVLHVFFTFTVFDYYRYPHLEIAVAIIAFIVYQNILFVVYLWHKKYRVTAILWLLCNLSGVTYSWLLYYMIISLSFTPGTYSFLNLLAYIVAGLTISTCSVIMVGKAKENRWLWWYACCLLVLQLFALIFTWMGWYNLASWVNYGSILPSVLLIIHFLAELRKTKRRDFEEDSVDAPV